MYACYDEKSVIQNLKDAGCDNTTAEAFMQCMYDGKVHAALKLLAAYRMTLLQNLHAQQKQIDCLDYLVYTVQKKNRAHSERNCRDEHDCK